MRMLETGKGCLQSGFNGFLECDKVLLSPRCRKSIEDSLNVKSFCDPSNHGGI